MWFRIPGFENSQKFFLDLVCPFLVRLKAGLEDSVQVPCSRKQGGGRGGGGKGEKTTDVHHGHYLESSPLSCKSLGQTERCQKFFSDGVFLRDDLEGPGIKFSFPSSLPCPSSPLTSGGQGSWQAPEQDRRDLRKFFWTFRVASPRSPFSPFPSRQSFQGLPQNSGKGERRGLKTADRRSHLKCFQNSIFVMR